MKEKIQKYLAGEREGFSLVELIIVIAIMAILIGVIALAVIPNIQKSRESKDLQLLDSIMSAANIAAANSQLEIGKTAEVKYAKTTGVLSYGANTPTSFQTAYENAIGTGKQKFGSAAAKDSGITCSVTIGNDGVATISVKADPAVTLKYTEKDDGTNTMEVSSSAGKSTSSTPAAGGGNGTGD